MCSGPSTFVSPVGPEDQWVRAALGQRGAETQHIGVRGEHGLDVVGIGEAQPFPEPVHRNHEAVAERLTVTREALRGEPVLGRIEDRGLPQPGQLGERLRHHALPLGIRW